MILHTNLSFFYGQNPLSKIPKRAEIQKLKTKEGIFRYMTKENKVRIIREEDGRELVIIDEIIFHGRRNIDWKAVEIYLRKYVGELVEVASTKEIISIRKDFPDEFVGSIYTKKLRGGLAKVKANLGQGIIQIVQIAKDSKTIENKKKKHIKNARYGWHYYKTRFAIPFYIEQTKEIRYHRYSALIIVRHDSNGEKCLYDIQDIKKEKY